MGRPAGSRNPDFTATRDALTRAARVRLAAPDGARASFRELAGAAGVSVATMRHYFGSREGIIAAVLALDHKAGIPYMLEVATGPLRPLRESLEWLLSYLGQGFRRGGLADVHTVGLAAGLRSPELGPAYLNEVLEPTLQSIEARLARHIVAGDLRPCDVRYATLALVSPALLALLHQGELGGAACRPLDYSAFVLQHVDAFIRAHGSDAGDYSSSSSASSSSSSPSSSRSSRRAKA